MAVARTEALPDTTTLRDVLPSLADKQWFIARVGDAAGIDAGFDGLSRGDAQSDELGGMTARDPRGIGVRGGYPQINVGIPGQEGAMLQFVRFAYERSAPARILVDKVASDVWGEWVSLRDVKEGLQKALERVCKNPTGRPGDRPLWWWLERAYRLARRDGRSLLYFILEDSKAATPNEAPRNVRGIRGLAIIRQDGIQQPILGTDPFKPLEYGRILAWRIRLDNDGPLGKRGNTVDVHADRCVPLIPYPLEDDEWNGKSVLAQNINYVEMLENLVWANAEAYFTEASPYIVVSLDKDVVLGEDEKRDAKAAIASMQQSLTQRIFLRGVTVTVLAGSGALANPLPHFEVAMKMFAMALGGIPTALLTGDQAGALTASKEDTRRYTGMMSKVQEQDADPVLRGVFSRFVAWGIESWGNRLEEVFDFTWNPLYESDAGEEATRQGALAGARKMYRDSGLPLPDDLDYEPVEWPEGTEEKPEPSLFGGFPAAFPGAPPAKPDDEAEDPKGDASRKGPPALEGVMRRMRARIQAALKPAFEAAVRVVQGNTDASRRVARLVGRGDDASIQVAIAIDNPKTREALAKAIADSYLDALQVGGNAAIDAVGRDFYFDVLKSKGPEVFRSLSGPLAGDVTRRLADDVRNLVADGLAEGKAPAEMGRLITERFDATRVDADRIARTESIRAFNRGTVDAMKEMGVQKFRFTAFSDADDGEADGPCAVLDGKEFLVGQEDAVPPIHPNCLLPGALVEGTVRAALQARYSGPVREFVTASGKRLSVTPNHPVATSQGFLPASAVEKGMHFVSHRRPVGVALGADAEHAPTRIEEVFNVFADASASQVVPLSPEDLHGDAERCEPDVCVASADGKLRDGFRARELFEEKALVSTVVQSQSLTSSSGEAQLLVASGSSSYGIMGSGGLSSASARIHVAPLQTLRIGLAPQFYASQAESAGERAAADTAAVTELLQACAGEVVLDEVVEVRDYHYAGHVYDLQAEGSAYWASSLLVHNCRCALVPVV